MSPCRWDFISENRADTLQTPWWQKTMAALSRPVVCVRRIRTSGLSSPALTARWLLSHRVSRTGTKTVPGHA